MSNMMHVFHDYTLVFSRDLAKRPTSLPSSNTCVGRTVFPGVPPVCKTAAPRLILEVTKNVRIGLRGGIGLELRKNCAMQGGGYKRLPLLFVGCAARRPRSLR